MPPPRRLRAATSCSTSATRCASLRPRLPYRQGGESGDGAPRPSRSTKNRGVELKATRVSRAGVTATTWNYGTERCAFRANEDDVQFRFNIASKGGGRTDIRLAVGAEDLPAILTEIAESHPRALALFTEALLKAHDRRMASIAERASAARKHGTSDLVDYMQGRYFEAPIGSDKLEGRLLRAATATSDFVDQIEDWARSELPPES